MEETSSMTSVLSQTAQDAMSSDFWWDILIKVISCVAIIVMAFVLYRLIMLPVKKFLVNDEKSRRGGTIFKNVVRVGVSVWAIACILDIAFNIDMAGILGALGIVGERGQRHLDRAKLRMALARELDDDLAPMGGPAPEAMNENDGRPGTHHVLPCRQRSRARSGMHPARPS